MKANSVLFLLITLLALIAGGCTSQPPAKAQAAFDQTFTLKTVMNEKGMVFVGVGGEIDGVTNPDLTVRPGQDIRLVLLNGDGMPHDLAIPDLNVQIAMITTNGEAREAVFKTGETGIFAYFCTISGHRQAGMEGKLIVQ